MTTRQHPRPQVRAFTLIEMLVTMAIFILLVGAVFGIVSAVLQSSTRLADDQVRQDQSSALQAYLRQKLARIPASGLMVTYHRDEDAAATSGLIFGDIGELTALDAILQPNGYHTLRVVHYFPAANLALQAAFEQLQAEILQNDAALEWSTLVHDITQCDWRFLAPGATEWVNQWTVLSSKPNLIEVNLAQAGDLQPVVADIWIPKVDPVGTRNILAAPAADTGGTNHAP